MSEYADDHAKYMSLPYGEAQKYYNDVIAPKQKAKSTAEIAKPTPKFSSGVYNYQSKSQANMNQFFMPPVDMDLDKPEGEGFDPMMAVEIGTKIGVPIIAGAVAGFFSMGTGAVAAGLGASVGMEYAWDVYHNKEAGQENPYALSGQQTGFLVGNGLVNATPFAAMKYAKHLPKVVGGAAKLLTGQAGVLQGVAADAAYNVVTDTGLTGAIEGRLPSAGEYGMSFGAALLPGAFEGVRKMTSRLPSKQNVQTQQPSQAPTKGTTLDGQIQTQDFSANNPNIPTSHGIVNDGKNTPGGMTKTPDIKITGQAAQPIDLSQAAPQTEILSSKHLMGNDAQAKALADASEGNPELVHLTADDIQRQINIQQDVVNRLESEDAKARKAHDSKATPEGQTKEEFKPDPKIEEELGNLGVMRKELAAKDAESQLLTHMAASNQHKVLQTNSMIETSKTITQDNVDAAIKLMNGLNISTRRSGVKNIPSIDTVLKFGPKGDIPAKMSSPQGVIAAEAGEYAFNPKNATQAQKDAYELIGHMNDKDNVLRDYRKQITRMQGTMGEDGIPVIKTPENMDNALKYLVDIHTQGAKVNADIEANPNAHSSKFHMSLKDQMGLAELLEETSHLSHLKNVSAEDANFILRHMDESDFDENYKTQEFKQDVNVLHKELKAAYDANDFVKVDELSDQLNQYRAVGRVGLNAFEPKTFRNQVLPSGLNLDTTLKQIYGENIIISNKPDGSFTTTWKGYDPNSATIAIKDLPLVQAENNAIMNLREQINRVENDVENLDLDFTRVEALEDLKVILSNHTTNYDVFKAAYSKALDVRFNTDNAIEFPNTVQGKKDAILHINDVSNDINNLVRSEYGSEFDSLGREVDYTHTVAKSKEIENGLMSSYNNHSWDIDKIIKDGGGYNQLSYNQQRAYRINDAHKNAIGSLRKEIKSGTYSNGNSLDPHGSLAVSPKALQKRYDDLYAKHLEIYDQDPGELSLTKMTRPPGIIETISVGLDSLISKTSVKIDDGGNVMAKFVNDGRRLMQEANKRTFLRQIGAKKSAFYNDNVASSISRVNRWLAQGLISTAPQNALQSWGESTMARIPAVKNILNEFGVKDTGKLNNSQIDFVAEQDLTFSMKRIWGLEGDGADVRSSIMEESFGDEIDLMIKKGGKIEDVMYKIVAKSPQFLNRVPLEFSRAANAEAAIKLVDAKIVKDGLNPAVRLEMFRDTLARLDIETGDSLRALSTSAGEGKTKYVDARTYFNIADEVFENMYVSKEANPGVTGMLKRGAAIAGKITNDQVLQKFTRWFYEIGSKQSRALNNTIRAANSSKTKAEALKTYANYGMQTTMMAGLMGVNSLMPVAVISSMASIIGNMIDENATADDYRRELDKYNLFNLALAPMGVPIGDGDINFEKFSADPLAYTSMLLSNFEDVGNMFHDVARFAKGERLESFLGQMVNRRKKRYGKAFRLFDEGKIEEGTAEILEAFVNTMSLENINNAAKRGYTALSGHSGQTDSWYGTLNRGPLASGAHTPNLEQQQKNDNMMYRMVVAMYSMIGASSNARQEDMEHKYGVNPMDKGTIPGFE